MSAAPVRTQGDLSPFDLAALQRWMQTVITHPAGVAEGMASRAAHELLPMTAQQCDEVFTRSRALSALERLGIYHHAYFARLTDCLRASFPVLRGTLGDEVFDEFAIGYLQTYPSQSYTLAELGKHFHRFLAETRPVNNEPDKLSSNEPSWPEFLIELATLELALNDAFDGPGSEQMPPLDRQRLQGLSSEQFLNARVMCSPSLQLLTFRFPVHRYWSQARKEPAEVPEARSCQVAIFRRDYVVRHLELSSAGWAILNSLQSGGTLLEALEAATLFDATGSNSGESGNLAGNLQRWFREWTAQGILVAIET